MGYSGVGKTATIRRLLKEIEIKGNSRIENIYEYREKQSTHIVPASPVTLSFRRRALEIGDIFVLVFAVNNLCSFEYAAELKDEICEIKGREVPIIFVGNKSDLRNSKMASCDSADHVSYAYADLEVSVEWEKIYDEVSAENGSGFESLLSNIAQQEHLISKRQFRFRSLLTVCQ